MSSHVSLGFWNGIAGLVISTVKVVVPQYHEYLKCNFDAYVKSRFFPFFVIPDE